MVEPVVQLESGVDLQTAIATLIKVGRKPSRSFVGSSGQRRFLLFLLVAGARIWGGHVLDRKKGTWYAVDFEDEQFGGYKRKPARMLLRTVTLLDLR